MKRLLYKRGAKSVWFAKEDGLIATWNEYQNEADEQVARARMQTEIQGGRTRFDGMRLEAMVPAHVLGESMRKTPDRPYGWTPDDWKKWANDPDNRDFRVQYDGRIKRL